MLTLGILVVVYAVMRYKRCTILVEGLSVMDPSANLRSTTDPSANLLSNVMIDYTVLNQPVDPSLNQLFTNFSLAQQKQVCLPIVEEQRKQFMQEANAMKAELLNSSGQMIFTMRDRDNSNKAGCMQIMDIMNSQKTSKQFAFDSNCSQKPLQRFVYDKVDHVIRANIKGSNEPMYARRGLPKEFPKENANYIYFSPSIYGAQKFNRLQKSDNQGIYLDTFSTEFNRCMILDKSNPKQLILRLENCPTNRESAKALSDKKIMSVFDF
jgi:hypothetical protein